MKQLILLLVICGVSSSYATAEVRTYNGTAMIENKFLSRVMEALKDEPALRRLITPHSGVVEAYYQEGGFWDAKTYVLKVHKHENHPNFPENTCLILRSEGWNDEQEKIDCAALRLDLSAFKKLSVDGLDMVRSFLNGGSWATLVTGGIEGRLRIYNTVITEEGSKKSFAYKGTSEVGDGFIDLTYQVQVERTVTTDDFPNYHYESKFQIELPSTWGYLTP